MRLRVVVLAFFLLQLVSSVPAHGQTTIATGNSLAPLSGVRGTPRLANRHPYTLWDDQDVAAYKASFATDKVVRDAFEELQAWGNKRIIKPVNVPAYRLEADGRWSFPDFKRGYQDASGQWKWEWSFNGMLQERAQDISNLGMLYILTGNEKYAAFATQILLSATDAYGYGRGGAVSDLNDYDHWEAYGFDGGDSGMFLAKACHGYDLIYKSIADKDRARIESGLIRPLAEQLKKSSFMYTTHDRWGMVCLYGLFIAGEVLDDASLRDLSLWGPGGNKDKATGGFMDCFRPGFLRDGVIWGAGATPGDQMAAASVMTAVAEVMWHRGVDLYGYQNEVLKKSFDAGLSILGSDDASMLNALPGVDAYQYAFRRYQDGRYLSLVRQLKPGFTLAIGEHLPLLPMAGR